jgi:transcription elongation factor Elf1
MARTPDQMILFHMAQAKTEHPELLELLDFYEKLFQIQFAFKAQQLLGRWDESGEAGEIRFRNLADGLPQITFDELGLQLAPLIPLYQNIADLLAPYLAVPRSPEKDPEPDRILEIARGIFTSRDPLGIGERAEDFPRNVSGFVLAPFLQRACEIILPRIPQNAWHFGTCPICGGKPSFAALTEDFGSRVLLCSRCNGEWSYSRLGCPFCERKDPQIYYASEDGSYRLYVCEACHRYLKTMDIRERGSDRCLPVENLVTVSMDLAAQQKGYQAF